jgi:hypothetical protein
MSESIEMRLVLRDEANPALEATRAKADAIAGSTSKAAQGVGQLEKGLTTLGTSAAAASRGLGTVDNSLAAIPSVAQRAWAALNTVDGKVLSLGDQAKALQQKMGPAAAAISGVSSALGENAGQAGKAVAAAGQLVAAFGSGGGIGVAIAGATLAVNTLTKAWDDEIAAQDKALANEYKAVDAAIKSTNNIRDRIDTLNAAISDASGGGGISGDSIFKIRERYAAESAALKDISEKLNQRLVMEGDLTSQEYGQLEQARKGLKLLDEAKAKEIELYKLRRDAKNGAGKGGVGKPVDAPAADPSLARIFNYDQLTAEDDALAAAGEKRRKAAAESQAEAARQRELDFINWQIDVGDQARKDREDAEIESAKRIAAEKKQIAEKSAGFDKAIEADRLALAQSAAGTLASTTQSYIEAKIAGGEKAKNAEALAIAASLKGIGDQLVGFGIMQEFKAATYAIDSGGLDPRAALLAGTGAAAIAAGLGLGAASAGITASIPSGGGGSSAEAARSTGASSSRSSSSSGAPSSTTINITYGGPTGRVAEDVAKDVEKSQRKNTKRGRA